MLCVHGLNQNPKALKTLLEAYQEKGIHCHLLHLPDHYSPDETRLPHSCESSSILSAYEESFRTVRQWADEAGTSMGVLGFSYGGLIATSQLATLRPEKLILLAPALRLRFYTSGVKLLSQVFDKVKSAPIGSPEVEAHYRYYQKGVPGSVYKSFFEILENFYQETETDYSGITGGVFIQPGDELVSYKKLRAWVREHTTWPFYTLKSKNAEMSRYRHLILDPKTLGEERFRFLVKESLGLLKSEG